MNINREKLTAAAAEAALGLAHKLEGCEKLSLSSLPEGNTALVLVDIINGFIKEGAMSCAEIGRIIPHTVSLTEKFKEGGRPIFAFADCHSEGAAEFLSFPVHCLKNTSESEIVSELKAVGGYTLIPKNSTNGFLEKGWQEILCKNPQINTFVVCGDCTDICVLQFCLSLKTWFNMSDRASRIIVPVNCVDTYGADGHNADLMNLAAFKIMSDSGVEFVSEITE